MFYWIISYIFVLVHSFACFLSFNKYNRTYLYVICFSLSYACISFLYFLFYSLLSFLLSITGVVYSVVSLQLVHLFSVFFCSIYEISSSSSHFTCLLFSHHFPLGFLHFWLVVSGHSHRSSVKLFYFKFVAKYLPVTFTGPVGKFSLWIFFICQEILLLLFVLCYVYILAT